MWHYMTLTSQTFLVCLELVPGSLPLLFCKFLLQFILQQWVVLVVLHDPVLLTLEQLCQQAILKGLSQYVTTRQGAISSITTKRAVSSITTKHRAISKITTKQGAHLKQLVTIQRTLQRTISNNRFVALNHLENSSARSSWPIFLI